MSSRLTLPSSSVCDGPWTSSTRRFLDAIAALEATAAPAPCEAGANRLLGANLVRAPPADLAASGVERSGVHASGIPLVADPPSEPNIIRFFVCAGVPSLSRACAPWPPAPAPATPPTGLAGTLDRSRCLVASNVNAGCADLGARMDRGMLFIADLLGGG